jgi:1-aminocyclopropane-1-carboxylate deaminase/D-cysteine desulfhydrase-like pyridoxal-dependent ACC family enzyme
MTDQLALDEYNKLKHCPTVPIAEWPTPIDEHTLPSGQTLLIKRDDLCGHGRGGAKARKIDHLIGYMKANGYDALITVAGNVTNVVYDILPVLETYEIEGHLLIIDDPPMAPTDRREVFEGVSDKITLMGTSRVQILRKALALRKQLRARGKRPFMVFPGLAHPAAIAGNAWGFVEMVEQRQRDNLPLPHTVYITVATGSTIAGFIIAEHLTRRMGAPPIAIVGVQIYSGPLRPVTHFLTRWTERHLGFKSRVPMDRLLISTEELHGGFGHFPTQIATTCQHVETEQDIQIDPIFGGKTWQHMIHHSHSAIPTTAEINRPILFWHCGYTPEWSMLDQLLHHT